jgi:CelD/BcsL family acetyltransferase involved in cellulose biosynthesis
MENRFAFEVLDSWMDILKIRPIWEELYQKSGYDHPFGSFDWLECWYDAFCRPDEIRVILVRDGAGIRAIFPAFRTNVVRKGIRLRAISSAGNGHSPRCCILSEMNDFESATAALLYPFSGKWGEKIDLVALLHISESSLLPECLRPEAKNVFNYTEHMFESPAFSLKEGWDDYFATRSRNFRHRFRQSRNNLEKLGPFQFEFVPLAGGREIVSRLRAIDAKTWQHDNGSGLFSSSENDAFYTSLITRFSKNYECFLGFIKTGGRDIAYELGFSHRKTGYLLKYGFDQEFAHFRPGVLVQHYLCEFLANRGIEEIDLCGEATEEKTKWATHFRKHENIWLLNQQSLIGKCTSWGLALLETSKSPGEAIAGRPA